MDTIRFGNASFAAPSTITSAKDDSNKQPSTAASTQSSDSFNKKLRADEAKEADKKAEKASAEARRLTASTTRDML